MPIIAGLVECIHQPGFQARGVFDRQPQGLGDLIGGLEADAINIAPQAVRVGLDHFERLFTVLLVDFDRQVGADPIAV